MPAGAALAMYDGVVEFMLSTTVALIVLTLLIAVIAWFSGSSRPATTLRGYADSAFGRLRASAEAHGVTTGGFGVGLDRSRGFVYAAIAIVAALVVLFVRPLTTGLVVWTVVLALLAVLLVQLLRRPAPEPSAVATTTDAPAPEPDGGVQPVAVPVPVLVAAGGVEAEAGEPDLPTLADTTDLADLTGLRDTEVLTPQEASADADATPADADGTPTEDLSPPQQDPAAPRPPRAPRRPKKGPTSTS